MSIPGYYENVVADMAAVIADRDTTIEGLAMANTDLVKKLNRVADDIEALADVPVSLLEDAIDRLARGIRKEIL